MRTNSYSGYLTVSETKQLHYVFLESKHDPQNDPVVIWMNGGPGCSSLLAMFQENGPFLVDDQLDPVFQENDYSWYNNANMLYIESPAGVGYSINKDEKPTFNDTNQSEDLIIAVLDWFKKYPEYKKNQLFISGESYAGIYVPFLGWQINEYNKKQTVEADKVNLVGLLVGNGVTNWEVDTSPADLQTWYQFNMIPKHLVDSMETNGCLFYGVDTWPHKGPASCEQVWDTINNMTGDLFIYDLYRVFKDTGSLKGEKRYGSVMIGGQEKRYKRGRTVAEYSPWLKHHPQANLMINEMDQLTDYVNKKETRAALHIPDEVQAWE